MERSIAPLVLRQLVFAVDKPERAGTVPCVAMLNVSIAVHPPVPVTVTIKLPEDRFIRSSVMAPLDQRKVFPDDGVMLRSIAPLGSPQEEGVSVGMINRTGVLSEMTKVSIEEQEVISVMVTVYEPLLRLERSSVIAPLDQENV